MAALNPSHSPSGGSSSSGRKALDPRLRRLVHDLDRQASTRLRADVRNSFVTTDEDLQASQVPDPQKLFKRVLVKLVRDQIPAPMAGLAWSKIVENIYSVNVPVNRLRDLAATEGVQFISAGHPTGQNLDSSRMETRTDVVHADPPAGPGIKGNEVLVGIVDFGCDFSLEDFRDSNQGTRIKFLWDQSLTPVGNERPPAGFSHGVEYGANDIDFTNGVTSSSGIPVRHRPGVSDHGTHVMGIAVGNGQSGDSVFPTNRYIGMAPEASIIFVQPAANDQQTSFTDSVHVAEAIAYIFRKAQEAGLPCVINMSLGQNGGSHDGESIVERAIDRLLEEPGRAFVVAAGNEHVWRPHASGTLAAGATRTLGWRVGGPIPLPSGPTAPGLDRTPNEMEIWYSSRDRFEVRVIDPAGNPTPFAVPDGPPVDHLLPGGTRVFIESERFTIMNGDARVYIEMSPGATGPGTIQSGLWKVEIRALEVRDGRFDAWIERDVRDPLNNFADQSIFEGADFDPTMTLGTPATTRRVIAVANYRHTAPVGISASSSRGLTRDGRPKPEVAAPGTDIHSSNSRGGQAVPAPAPPGTLYPIRVSMSGTSMAAPHVAGIAALLFAKEKRLTAAQVSKILVSAARPHPGAGGPGFDPAFGFGLIDADEALKLVP
ncbi:S8 family peptidase [Singulisphaera acidiphila]|uniref:Subtilisin-like serine protease n=1 Tax=Singulisphaera acidiphila (strain ATCC BAA-1392 / DSM 18658 / VKM B-2454 / MOB10) TaxID=886293 RepID=L0DSR6_SINAD|nr:S8 family peptidase [Singulisphaera acidiphila]AGA31401.1 subtilisin-like serine protease [Singulisphaera acidiphila DSM 18658]